MDTAPLQTVSGVARTRRVRVFRLFGFLLLLATALGAVSGAAGPASASDPAGAGLRAPTVDSALVERIAAKPEGVTAIVTAWGRDGLDDIEKAGVTGTKLRVLPMIITHSLTQSQLDKLRASPAVRSVWGERKYETFMEDSTWITKARYVWQSSTSGPASHRGFGVTGRGVELALIDTGFDGGHEDGDNLIEFCDTTNAAAATGERFFVQCTPWVAAHNVGPAGPCGLAYPGPSNVGPGPTTFPPGCRNKARGDSWAVGDPDVSHGTHVGGTMVGTGHASGGKQFNHSTIGMAPDAKLRAYSANVGPSLLNTQTLAAYDDMTYKKEIGYSNVIAVNNSWGGGDGANYDPSDPTAIAVKRAYDAGIVSVFAAGNSGPEHNTLSAQCVIPYVVCVAASTKPDSVVMFSSKGRPSQPQDTNRNGVIGQPGAEEGDANYDPDDIPPDNHDRLLGQKLELGLYRPTLTAPGVNINSMKAIGANIGDPTSAACREDDQLALDVKAGCYVQANGTSMATPHVTGAIGLIGQVLKEQGRNLRSSRLSADIIDILERSANTSKLPAWESEEQGAGRLDVYQAVRYTKGLVSLRRPNFGYPTPPYENGQYPGSATNGYTEKGCDGTLSWTVRDGVQPVSPIGIGQPPGAPPQRYGQHFIDVQPNTDRLRITATWATPGENHYLRLWRPGVNPDAESATPDAGPANGGRPSAYFQSRVFPDQEAVGLVFTGNSRWLEVRSPEESNPGPRTRRPVPGEGSAKPGPTDPVAIPAGTWILRVYHRAGGAPQACDPTSQERPKQAEGHNYDLRIELPRVTYRPSVKIDRPANDSRHSERFVEVAGRAGYPPHTQRPPGVREETAPPLGHVGYSWEGITNWEVPGSSRGATGGEPTVPRVTLYMHGQSDPHPTPETGCIGQGEQDVVLCNGPFLMPKGTLSAKPAAFWRTGIDDEIFDGTSDRSIHDPNWSWCLAAGPGCPVDPGYTPPGTHTVSGPMTVEWWAQCNLCGGLFSADWIIRVWGDGVLRAQERVSATPAALGVPDRLTATINVPTFTATQRVVVHVDPVYVDSQTITNIYYDSEAPCVPGVTTGRCDSLVRMPATPGTGGGGSQNQPPATPDNVRVTDLPANPATNHPYPQSRPLSPALRVAWDSAERASRYEVYRSTDPTFPSGGTRVYSGPGTACTSPQAPTPNQPPGHDREGLCFTDQGVSFLVTYYYRVVAVTSGGLRSTNSEVAYGAPTRYDRQVKVKVDRLYGPQYWEYALLPPSPTPPDTTNPGTDWLFFWDTLELTNSQFAVNLTPTGRQIVEQPNLGHLLFARSFTQGIGSTKDGRAVNLDEDGGDPGPGPGPGCPDDDDGDRDDDDDDGDRDDDGDDGDDDCEDDDDDEEEDDD